MITRRPTLQEIVQQLDVLSSVPQALLPDHVLHCNSCMEHHLVSILSILWHIYWHLLTHRENYIA